MFCLLRASHDLILLVHDFNRIQGDRAHDQDYLVLDREGPSILQIAPVDAALLITFLTFEQPWKTTGQTNAHQCKP